MPVANRRRQRDVHWGGHWHALRVADEQRPEHEWWWRELHGRPFYLMIYTPPNQNGTDSGETMMQTRVVFLDGASRYLEHGMAEVQGWLTPCSASIIAHLSAHQLRLGLSGNVAEIGVHHGKLFILLANLTAPDEVAYAVDIFDDQHKNVDRSGKGDRVIFEDNVRKFAPHANVVVIQESSLELDGTDFMSTSGRALSLIFTLARARKSASACNRSWIS